MLGTCPICKEVCPIQSSTATNAYIMASHQYGDNDCNGAWQLPPVKYSIIAGKSAILPDWVSEVISIIAYDRGHSAGDDEVAMIEEGMIAEFEASMKKHKATP